MQRTVHASPPDLLTDLLKAVSRSFYLTLRVLPRAVRPQIGLAYLLARATDTVADTELVPPEERLQALEQLQRRISGQSSEKLSFEKIARSQTVSAEQTLLARCEEALALIETFPAADQRCIRQVLATITSGQALDLERFAQAGEGRLIALATDQELDDYTYRVAGCVGEFWTRICRLHLFPGAPLDEKLLITEGVRFGKGLQLVNILRDLPRDLRQGRCYLPERELEKSALRPEDLLNSGNESRFRPIYESYLARAEQHLAAGWSYTNRLPRTQVRVRLACAWPILIGFKTIDLLKQRPVLDPAQRVKVSRAEIKRIIARSVLLYPWKMAWKRQAREAVEPAELSKD
jgi:farnesyl-diphosphate farnesyltransferase